MQKEPGRQVQYLPCSPIIKCSWLFLALFGPTVTVSVWVSVSLLCYDEAKYPLSQDGTNLVPQPYATHLTYICLSRIPQTFQTGGQFTVPQNVGGSGYSLKTNNGQIPLHTVHTSFWSKKIKWEQIQYVACHLRPSDLCPPPSAHGWQQINSLHFLLFSYKTISHLYKRAAW